MKQVIKNLKEAKEYLISINAQEIDDLNRKQIRNLFNIVFCDYETDGDSDGISRYVPDTPICAFSNAQYDDEFISGVYSIYFDENQNQNLLKSIDFGILEIIRDTKIPVILNTSILTNFGSYEYEPLTLEESKIVIENGFESAVGHQSTCDVLTSLLEKEVKLNRVQYSQKVDDIALVFKLKGRPEEGKILSVADIEEIGYEFGKLTRLS